jgi:hypothetical protein
MTGWRIRWQWFVGILVVRGARDPICNEGWAGELRLGGLVVVPDVAHSLVFTSPHALFEARRGFIERPAPQRVAHRGLQRQGGAIVYSAVEGLEFVAAIEERRCTDSMSGSLFAYSVEVRLDGRNYTGCVAHNPAMPAP